MYSIIYNYLQTLFDNNNLVQYESSIMGVNTTLQDWLCHTGTIVILIALFIALASMVVWLFKLFANAWK